MEEIVITFQQLCTIRCTHTSLMNRLRTLSFLCAHFYLSNQITSGEKSEQFAIKTPKMLFPLTGLAPERARKKKLIHGEEMDPINIIITGSIQHLASGKIIIFSQPIFRQHIVQWVLINPNIWFAIKTLAGVAINYTHYNYLHLVSWASPSHLAAQTTCGGVGVGKVFKIRLVSLSAIKSIFGGRDLSVRSLALKLFLRIVSMRF